MRRISFRLIRTFSKQKPQKHESRKQSAQKMDSKNENKLKQQFDKEAYAQLYGISKKLWEDIINHIRKIDINQIQPDLNLSSNEIQNPLFARYIPFNSWMNKFQIKKLAIYPIFILSTIVWQKFGFLWSIPCWIFFYYRNWDRIRTEYMGFVTSRVSLSGKDLILFENTNTYTFAVRLEDLIIEIDKSQIKKYGVLTFKFRDQTNPQNISNMTILSDNCVVSNVEVMIKLLKGNLKDLSPYTIKQRPPKFESIAFGNMIVDRAIKTVNEKKKQKQLSDFVRANSAQEKLLPEFQDIKESFLQKYAATSVVKNEQEENKKPNDNNSDKK